MPRAAAPISSADAAADRIYAVVRRIPRGCVATYGEVAALAGIASGHRVAARAMRVCPESLPWHRVLGKKDARRGYVSIDEPDHASLQRGLLEREGVVFDANGGVSLTRFGWLSKAVGPASARAASARAAKKRTPAKKRLAQRAATTKRAPRARKRRAP